MPAEAWNEVLRLVAANPHRRIVVESDRLVRVVNAHTPIRVEPTAPRTVPG